MIQIQLTGTEIMQGATVGLMRQLQNLKQKRCPAFGAGTTADWQLHIEGALGEMALAKYLNYYWGGVGVLRNPDVFDNDVRTRSRHHYELILHDHDPDDRRFWLLTGTNGAYVVHGWILGRDGKQKDFWKDPAGGRPAYFVPQEKLTKPAEAKQ